MTLAFGKAFLNLGTSSMTTSALGIAQQTRFPAVKAIEILSNIISVFPAPHTARFENLKILGIKNNNYNLGGITMLESRKATYYGFAVTMYRIGDHLWISNVLPNAQHLVKQFNYDKMIWIQATYTTNEIENLFNVSSHALK